MKPVNTAVIYYSATGTVHTLAQAVAEGADKAGAVVRLRKVAETATSEAVNANQAWARHVQETAEVTEASLADVDWADVVLFGTPSRFGNPAGQLKAFIDGAGALWRQGRLAGKVYSAFTASGTPHGGQESTILALANVFYHWGGIIVPPVTPLRSSSSRATRTAPRMWLPTVRPGKWPGKRRNTRPAALWRRLPR
ncbi:hypothetical protein Jiend_53590 [Micromonospora endophytica]|nr:hypothetical protein Jiend_53590 [Micromonospora endophytica]